MLTSFHFGSKPGDFSLSIRLNSSSAKRATSRSAGEASPPVRSVHFTATPPSRLTGRCRERGAFQSVDDLKAAIDRFSQSLPVYADVRTILQFASKRRSLIHYLPIQPKVSPIGYTQGRGSA